MLAGNKIVGGLSVPPVVSLLLIFNGEPWGVALIAFYVAAAAVYIVLRLWYEIFGPDE